MDPSFRVNDEPHRQAGRDRRANLETCASLARGLLPSAATAPGATRIMPSVFLADSISAERPVVMTRGQHTVQQRNVMRVVVCVVGEVEAVTLLAIKIAAVLLHGAVAHLSVAEALVGGLFFQILELYHCCCYYGVSAAAGARGESARTVSVIGGCVVGVIQRKQGDFDLPARSNPLSLVTCPVDDSPNRGGTRFCYF